MQSEKIRMKRIDDRFAIELHEDYFTPLCLIFNNARGRSIDWFLDSVERNGREKRS